MLRFFAFLAVFVHHGIYNISPITSTCGAFGLSLFFFLSAFLITELLQRERALTGSIALRNFYVRRILRIWPLYFGFVLLMYVLGQLIPQYRAGAGFYLSYTFMVANVFMIIHGVGSGPLVPLWSISIEEQFYLLWPLPNRYLNRRKLCGIALCSIPLATVTIAILAAHHVANLIWFNSFVQFQMFAGGILVSLILKGRVPHFAGSRRIALVLVGSCLWITAARWSGITDAHPRAALGMAIGYYAVGLGCACIFLSVYGLPAHRIPNRLVYLGKISYGLYVFHALCLDTAAWVANQLPWTRADRHHVLFGLTHLSVGLLLTVPLAALSYKYFEKPFLKLKDSFAAIKSRAA
jgi:peptidoglycan/LPS O-acetylase OafA/YrhL